MTATLPGAVEARISGHVSGQIAVGNHIIQNNVDHGGIVYIAAPGETPTPRLRSLPISLPGRRPAEPLGRDDEVRVALDAVGAASSLEFVGPPGIGKTTLLKFLAYRAPSDAAPHGVVYHRSHTEPVEDTLQHLFEAFYETNVPFKPTRAQVQHALRDVEALIVIDDVEAGRDAVDLLRDTLPSSAFLLASGERALWGNGRSVRLRGLSLDAALDLLELELMRPVAESERPLAAALVNAVNAHPLRIMHVAALITDLGHDLNELASRVGEGSAPQELGQLVLDALDSDQRKVWEVLAALDGATLPADQLAEVTGVAEPEPVLASLLALGLIQAHSPRYSVTAPAGAVSLNLAARVRSWDTRTREHFIGWAEANRDQADAVLEESEAVLAVLHRAAREQAWGDLLRLGRAVEGAFVVGRRWATWRQILDLELTGARRVGARAAEGWALHQLGTRSLCLGEHTLARSSLTEALRIRESLGDQPGAEATRHNLDLLPGGGISKPAAPTPVAPVVPPVVPVVPPIVAATSPLLSLPLVLLFGVLAVVTVGASAYIIEQVRPGPVVTINEFGLTVDPTRLDFGDQRVGTSSDPRRVAVTNDRQDAFPLASISTAGPAADAYRLDLSDCAGPTLPPGGSCAVSVVFAPSTAGSHEATLVIGSTEDGQQAVVLSGRGTEGPTPPPPTGPLRLDPATLNFGRHPVNAQPVVQRLTIANTNGSAIEVTGASITGPDARDFRLERQCLRRLAPGQVCAVDVSFVATAPRPRSAIVTVSGSGQSPQATLLGEGFDDGLARVVIDPVGPVTVAYGGTLDVPMTARAGADSSRLTLTVSDNAPQGVAIVREGDGRWRLRGRVLAKPGPQPIQLTATASVPGRDPPAGTTFALTVVPADLSITWLQPVIDATVGTPVVAKALLTQTSGTQGDFRMARVSFSFQDLVTGATVIRAADEITSDGVATVSFMPGELPLGAYTATASVDPSNEYFRMASSAPISVVVNSDLASASVNVLNMLLGGKAV